MRVALLVIVGLALAVAGCADDKPNPNPNVVNPALLYPVLLDDRAEMASYVAALPPGMYQQYEVKHVGKFHLDDIPGDGIKQWLRKGVMWEQHLVAHFRRHARAATTVIDAGAHIGTHTLTFARLVGSEGRVYAFEPQKKLYRELVHNAKLNQLTNIVPLRFALGAQPGVIEMDRVSEQSEGSTAVGKGGDKAELRPIDSFGFTNVSLIKIDVEGFEDAVLEGARLTIARSRPVIIIEIMGGADHANPAPEVRKRIEVTKAKLGEMGYKVSHIETHDYLALPADRGAKP
jgi:FkbM family methyltransferase